MPPPWQRAVQPAPTLLMIMSPWAGGQTQNLNIMYTLNFPNGNVQTYNSMGDLQKAARLMGGEAKLINGKTYAFVAKK